jgi:hypothetical protein
VSVVPIWEADIGQWNPEMESMQFLNGLNLRVKDKQHWLVDSIIFKMVNNTDRISEEDIVRIITMESLILAQDER